MQENRKIFTIVIIISILISSLFGTVMGFGAGMAGSRWGGGLFSHMGIRSWGKWSEIKSNPDDTIRTVREESAVTTVAEKAAPAVVSIIISKDLPKYEQYFDNSFGDSFFRQFFGGDLGQDFGFPQYRQNGTEKQEVGGGSGFIIGADGTVVTNKHVVADAEAEYTVVTNDDKKYIAKVLARDPVNDLAILKIDARGLPVLELGDSSKLKVGQSVIAIGNALAEFKNTVSTGVVSGLSRSVTAGGAGIGSEQLSGVIQTDASINPGNSGGPLLNIDGQVIGINTAVAQGAQGIGFAIPINAVKNSIDSVQKNGKIVRPWLGVRYVQVTEEIASANQLEVDYGALIIRGDNKTDLAVMPGSPADKAGLEENDIILEVDGVKVDEKNPLPNLVGKHKAGDAISLKILHKGDKKDVPVKLEEMK